MDVRIAFFILDHRQERHLLFWIMSVQAAPPFIIQSSCDLSLTLPFEMINGRLFPDACSDNVGRHQKSNTGRFVKKHTNRSVRECQIK